MSVVDRLREQARDYELNALSFRDRGDFVSEQSFTIAALVTYGLANAFAEADGGLADDPETRAA